MPGAVVQLLFISFMNLFNPRKVTDLLLTSNSEFLTVSSLFLHISSTEPVPVKSTNNPFAVQRPHATANLLERQGSFRGFEKLQETSSPFKRTLSLRLNELPSTLQRQNAVMESPTQNGNGGEKYGLHLESVGIIAVIYPLI